jgi:Fe-S-cluster-containing dehydrogenase component
MRVLFYNAERCVACRTCEEACSETFFREVDAEKSKIRIHSEGDGLPSASFCNQCGECISVCPADAIYRDKRGVVRIRRELCVGCLTCVGFCPSLVMYWHVDQTVPFKCVSCGICARECPEDALEIVEVDEPPAPAEPYESV